MGEDRDFRFIKKIPPSGGQPSYKLTLPHSVVRGQLAGFVDKTFELASSADASQCWQGRISPRRNKDRNEFILQGWKLFATGNSLKAGDQVSFEVVSPRRLVIKCLQPALVVEPLPKCRDFLSDVLEPPAKAQKSLECPSPSKRTAWAIQQEASPIESLTSLLQSSPSRSPMSARPISCHSPSSPGSNGMAGRVQSWMSMCHSDPLLGESMTEYSHQQAHAPASSAALLPALNRGRTEPSSPGENGAQAASFLPGIFDFETDMEGFEQDISVLGDPALSMHPSRKVASLESNRVPSMIPPTAHVEPSQATRSSLERGSLDSSHTARAHLSIPALEGESRSEADFRALVGRMRDQLDTSTRFALQATMKMETSVVDLSNTGVHHDRNAVQAQMFSHLSGLKESLWQILVIANEIHSPSTTADTRYSGQR